MIASNGTANILLPTPSTPPYVTAIVQLEEGPRMMTTLVGVDPDPAQIACDMPVEVTWEDVNDEIAMPLFRPAQQGAAS